MDFFNKIERKCSRYAIRNLMYYIIILYSAGLVISLWNPMIYYQYLCLDISAVMRGQIWRLLTFMIYPPSFASWNFGGSLISGFISFIELMLAVLVLRVYYGFGIRLENTWGAFRFNVFFFSGVIGQILASMVSYLVFKTPILVTPGYLNASLFLAFAICYPNTIFLIFFVLPVKAKWLALLDVFIFLFDFVYGTTAARWAIVFSLANVIIFFLVSRNLNRFSPKEIKRRREFQRGVKMKPFISSRHKCAVCGRTEKDDEDLEFRYCSKCEGSYEYCQDHLYTHQHVEKDSVTNK